MTFSRTVFTNALAALSAESRYIKRLTVIFAFPVALKWKGVSLMIDTENVIIGYDKYTETFSLRTKTHYKCDVTEQMFDFFAKIYDILTARGYPFGITYRTTSVIFAYGKATGEVISDEIKYNMCYKYLEEPKKFCDLFLN